LDFKSLPQQCKTIDFYRVGGALEMALEDRWGGPLIQRIPDLVGGSK